MLKSVRNRAYDIPCSPYVTGGFRFADINAKLLAGISELREGVLFDPGVLFAAVIKHRAVIREELVRDAVPNQYLAVYVVVAIQGFLRVKPLVPWGIVVAGWFL